MIFKIKNGISVTTGHIMSVTVFLIYVNIFWAKQKKITEYALNIICTYPSGKTSFFWLVNMLRWAVIQRIVFEKKKFDIQNDILTFSKNKRELNLFKFQELHNGLK